ncbi:MAG TPA: MBL fold metallo-hydrolase, partial [Anaerolineae bacterium]|nr:MBL fold metallo-hydrolase [Anaerolineae bacterium]
MRTKVLMLGTGTPNYAPSYAQQCAAVVVDEQAYLIDCGDGAMTRIIEARDKYGLQSLNFSHLTRLFI